MSAVLINTLTVLAGSFIGIFLKKGIPEKYTGATMTAIGLFSMVIGFQGALKAGTCWSFSFQPSSVC